MGRYVIKAGDLVCDALYLIPFDNFKQWYKPYEKNEGKTIVMLNTFILTKVKVKSINDSTLLARDSNNLRGDAIRLVAVYFFNIMHTIKYWRQCFQGRNYITMN